MTELPRYIGRHASPEAAAPSSDETTPEPAPSSDDPSMPRLEFDPGNEEATTVFDHPDVYRRKAPGPSMPSPDRWGGPPRDETPPPGPEPPESFRPPGISGPARLPGSPGRPIRPDSWTTPTERSSTPLADAVASTPPQPPPVLPSLVQPVQPPPRTPEPDSPSQVETEESPDTEPWWSSPAPDVPTGPVPAPEPLVEAAAAPTPAPALPDAGGPETETASEPSDPDAAADDAASEAAASEAAATDDAAADLDHENDGAEPTIETAVADVPPAADVAPEPAVDATPEPAVDVAPEPPDDVAPERGPDGEPDPAADAAAAPEPDSASEPETDLEPEADHAPDPEPEPEPEAELDIAPDAEPEPSTRAGPPSSSAPFTAWRDKPMLTPAPGPIRRSPVNRQIDSHGLARLSLLDAVDETWPGGTPDLSAWLAANLELLEDPLGFALTPMHPVPLSPERQVSGGYDVEPTPLDLPGNIVTADGSGATVMVRAQVGEADPEGLGALLAAAAASQAQTAVWVCPRIDDGFRQALRWVGGDPSANVRLYGLEMYLVRINDSSIAPLFDAVVAPGTP